MAPHSPPISAWLELDGRPSHHVSRFQAIAASNAVSTVLAETKRVSTRPWPIVLATAVPLSAPSKLKTVDSTMAWRGVRTLVEIVVAMALAVSWKPLVYSKINATHRTVKIRVMSC